MGQQRQISQFAAQSTGRYMLVATNSGETIVINPAGKILAQAPIDKAAILESTIESMTGSTPWVRWGNLPFIAFIIGLIIARVYHREN